MDLDLRVSTRMTKAGEDDRIRLTPGQKRKLGVQNGAHLYLNTAYEGRIYVTVDDTHSTESAHDRGAAWVSQYVFDVVVGNPTDPDVVTLGCDPEFLLFDSRHKILPANYWLPTKGFVGSDGPLAELRPSPAAHEDEVVENLRRLIRAMPGLTRHYFGSPTMADPEGHSCWENYALGFHVHLGIPRELTTGAAAKSREFLAALTATLDYFVGVPAMLLEDTNLRRLGDGLYGKPGDFRVTNRTVEYRTPGGYHLRHPDYAAGIMGLALCVAREAIEDARIESLGWRYLHECANFSWFQKKFHLPNKSKIRWALSEATKQAAVELLPGLVDNILKLRYFGEHESSIRRYFRHVVENKQFSPKLLDNW